MQIPATALAKKIDMGEHWAFERDVLEPAWEYKDLGDRIELCFSFGDSASRHSYSFMPVSVEAIARLAIWNSCSAKIVWELTKWQADGWKPERANFGKDNLILTSVAAPMGLTQVNRALPMAFRITLVHG